ncbi:MAG: MFS transporter [Thermoanaerobaculia bacterium]
MTSAGYLELLRGNRGYRKVWLGSIASNLGDWLNVIAVYTLIDRLTGSPLALGLVFVTKMLPFALASPVAGLLADRWNRRRLMIGADLVRALLVLGLLLVRDAAHLPLLYVVVALQMVVSAAFLPARNASIPNLVSDRELLTANALSSATWSALLAVGAALGGLATEALGIYPVFLLDSGSYLISAWFLYRTVIPQHTDSEPAPLLRTAWRQVAEGWRYMRSHPGVGRVALAKPAWAFGGGSLVYMLALVGQRLIPGAPAAGIGWLYAARGLGTGLGPIATRRWVPRRLWLGLVGLAAVVSGAAYQGVAWMPWTLWLTVPVLVAHTASGANWVLSTVMLQERSEDRFRGRVFATEWLLLTSTDAVSIVAASLLLESGALTLRGALALFAAVQLATGALWVAVVAPRERATGGELVADPAAGPSRRRW